MRIDALLLERCARGEVSGALRLYSFSPACLSLGRFQSREDVDIAACKRDGIDVVRRPSGGRAVLHDGEVTYAIVCRVSDPDLGGPVLDACARIHKAVAAGLARLGVETRVHASQWQSAGRRPATADCFSRPSAHELLDTRGRKLVGSAQARRGGALLQHGSVLLEAHRASRYLRSSEPAVRSGSLSEILGRPVTFDEVATAILAGFRQTLGERLAGTASRDALTTA